MSAIGIPTPVEERPHPESRTNYLNVSHTLRSWLTTGDHKRIAILYLISISAFFFLGATRSRA